MDLQSRKIAFVQEFLRLQNEEVISILERILHQKRVENYEKDLNAMSREQFNEDIDQALDDAESGRFTKAHDLKSKAGKWG